MCNYNKINIMEQGSFEFLLNKKIKLSDRSGN